MICPVCGQSIEGDGTTNGKEQFVHIRCDDGGNYEQFVHNRCDDGGNYEQ